MIAKVTSTVFPLINDPHLRQLALSLDNVKEVSNEHGVYHLGRYDSDGLYGRVDPAKQEGLYYGKRLVDSFSMLDNPSNALAVVAEKGLQRVYR